jgi:hypothetical protein
VYDENGRFAGLKTRATYGQGKQAPPLRIKRGHDGDIFGQSGGRTISPCYRATILAFLNEWSVFAERNGVDLITVITAIKVRPTHSNIIFPGPGIGGYCLPKDGGLGYWALSRRSIGR